jgi:NADP-dependent 3-hydroxy acid dehydrogenase YdfG
VVDRVAGQEGSEVIPADTLVLSADGCRPVLNQTISNELTTIYIRNSYTNKIVLVTGGTSGIGKATALAFAKAGAKVVITGRREKEGAEITKNGGTAAFVRADVAKDADVVKAIDFVVSTHNRLDVAFNNARVEITGPLDQVTGEQYRRTFDITGKNVVPRRERLQEIIRARRLHPSGRVR